MVEVFTLFLQAVHPKCSMQCTPSQLQMLDGGFDAILHFVASQIWDIREHPLRVAGDMLETYR